MPPMIDVEFVTALQQAMPEKVTRVERIVCALIRSDIPKDQDFTAAKLIAFARQIEHEMDVKE